MNIKFIFAIFSVIFALTISNSTAFAQELETPTPTPSPKVTKQQLCSDSPECYWEDPNCICANGKTPLPDPKITWNVVEGYKGSSFNADPTAATPVASVSGNIFKNVKPAEAKGVENSTQAQPTLAPLPTPTAPPFEQVQELKTESTLVQVQSVQKVDQSPSNSTQPSIKISGIGPSDSYIFLYIFSDPIVVTVKTNQKGEWSYFLEKKLEKGDHKIYAAAKTNTLDYIKSKVVDISVVPAVRAEGEIPSDSDFEIVVSPSQDIFKNFVRNAAIITAVAVAGLIIILKVFRDRKRIKTTVQF
jgi:hypothetical protein